MRIAWIGPMPNQQGGAAGVAYQLLEELSLLDIEVDCYFPGSANSLPDSLKTKGNINNFTHSSNWSWNKWYSKIPLMAFVTGQISNLKGEIKLAKKLYSNHLHVPYDLVYQFSHIELSALKRYKNKLPKIIIHPSVHAAGELKWHRKESKISGEKIGLKVGTRLLLYIRSKVQKRDIKAADYVFGISRSFIEEMMNDYHVDENKFYLVPNPINTKEFIPITSIRELHEKENKLKILFVSRIAVRKGVEMIVELSNRLEDLSAEIEIEVVGNRSLWSDYRKILDNLNPNNATYIGKIEGNKMSAYYNTVDILIQPSHYEPFGLTVGEALACGTPVIASDKVGATEGISQECCRIFDAGNMDLLEKRTRELIKDIKNPNKRKHISEIARDEAVRLYTTSKITEKLYASFVDITNNNEENSTYILNEKIL